MNAWAWVSNWISTGTSSARKPWTPANLNVILHRLTAKIGLHLKERQQKPDSHAAYQDPEMAKGRELIESCLVEKVLEADGNPCQRFRPRHILTYENIDLFLPENAKDGLRDILPVSTSDPLPGQRPFEEEIILCANRAVTEWLQAYLNDPRVFSEITLRSFVPRCFERSRKVLKNHIQHSPMKVREALGSDPHVWIAYVVAALNQIAASVRDKAPRPFPNGKKTPFDINSVNLLAGLYCTIAMFNAARLFNSPRLFAAAYRLQIDLLALVGPHIPIFDMMLSKSVTASFDWLWRKPRLSLRLDLPDEPNYLFLYDMESGQPL